MLFCDVCPQCFLRNLCVYIIRNTLGASPLLLNNTLTLSGKECQFMEKRLRKSTFARNPKP